jgi:hypothetical protein
VPVTSTVDSWVTPVAASQVASSTSFFTTTHWRSPVPSRTTTKATRPWTRVVSTHPATVTDSPARWERSFTSM